MPTLQGLLACRLKTLTSPTGTRRARHGLDVQILEGDHDSCIQCHKLHSRLGRILKSTEMDKDYGLCDEATKQKIMADGTNHFGDDLKKLVTEKITEKKIVIDFKSFSNLGQFKDEFD